MWRKKANNGMTGKKGNLNSNKLMFQCIQKTTIRVMGGIDQNDSQLDSQRKFTVALSQRDGRAYMYL